MRNWKCKLEIHQYENIGEQTIKVGNITSVSSNSGAPIQRIVYKCDCGHIKYEGLELGMNYNNNSFKWQPSLESLILKNKINSIEKF